ATAAVGSDQLDGSISLVAAGGQQTVLLTASTGIATGLVPALAGGPTGPGPRQPPQPPPSNIGGGLRFGGPGGIGTLKPSGSGPLVLGGPGQAGEATFTAKSGLASIHVNGASADLRLGGAGQSGTIVISDSDRNETIWMEDGAITLRDKRNSNTVRVDGGR